MNVILGVVAVAIVLGIFGILQIRGLAKRAGEADAREAQSDELFQAQTRRQKMARRARARGRVLVERMSKWGRGSSS